LFRYGLPNLLPLSAKNAGVTTGAPGTLATDDNLQRRGSLLQRTQSSSKRRWFRGASHFC